MFAYGQGTHVVVFRVPGTDAWLGSRLGWNTREGDAAVQERFFAAALGAV